MANFKGIIRNMVESNVTDYAEKRNGNFFEVVEGTFNMTNGNSTEHPMWNVEIKELSGFHDYRVAGYVSDYGIVVICSVSYTRTYCDKDGSNPRTQSEYLYGKEMEAFGFDK
jgi:hypothetical protein